MTSLESLRENLAALLAHPEVSIEEFACAMGTSRSGVQRAFRRHGSTYTRELRFVRVERATEEIVRKGRSARDAAELVGVTPDHLCRLLKETHGLTAKQLVRARDLERQARRWLGQTPPRAGTPLYRRRRQEWIELEAELDSILGDLPHTHALAPWAKSVLDAARRPDFRAREHRDRIAEQRRDEAEAISMALNDVLAPGATPSTAVASQARRRRAPRPAAR